MLLFSTTSTTTSKASAENEWVSKRRERVHQNLPFSLFSITVALLSQRVCVCAAISLPSVSLPYLCPIGCPTLFLDWTTAAVANLITIDSDDQEDTSWEREGGKSEHCERNKIKSPASETLASRQRQQQQQQQGSTVQELYCSVSSLPSSPYA